MSSVRSFRVVAMLCPGAFAVAFSEVARRSELGKGPVLVAIAAVLLWLGWLGGLEPCSWAVALLGVGTVFLGTAVSCRLVRFRSVAATGGGLDRD
jgi:hypothetical protein